MIEISECDIPALSWCIWANIHWWAGSEGIGLKMMKSCSTLAVWDLAQHPLSGGKEYRTISYAKNKGKH